MGEWRWADGGLAGELGASWVINGDSNNNILGLLVSGDACLSSFSLCFISFCISYVFVCIFQRSVPIMCYQSILCTLCVVHVLMSCALVICGARMTSTADNQVEAVG